MRETNSIRKYSGFNEYQWLCQKVALFCGCSSESSLKWWDLVSTLELSDCVCVCVRHKNIAAYCLRLSLPRCKGEQDFSILCSPSWRLPTIQRGHISYFALKKMIETVSKLSKYLQIISVQLIFAALRFLQWASAVLYISLLVSFILCLSAFGLRCRSVSCTSTSTLLNWTELSCCVTELKAFHAAVVWRGVA